VKQTEFEPFETPVNSKETRRVLRAPTIKAGVMTFKKNAGSSMMKNRMEDDRPVSEKLRIGDSGIVFVFLDRSFPVPGGRPGGHSDLDHW